jgi:hypothetical protein
LEKCFFKKHCLEKNLFYCRYMSLFGWHFNQNILLVLINIYYRLCLGGCDFFSFHLSFWVMLTCVIKAHDKKTNIEMMFWNLICFYFWCIKFLDLLNAEFPYKDILSCALRAQVNITLFFYCNLFLVCGVDYWIGWIFVVLSLLVFYVPYFLVVFSRIVRSLA